MSGMLARAARAARAATRATSASASVVRSTPHPQDPHIFLTFRGVSRVTHLHTSAASLAAAPLAGVAAGVAASIAARALRLRAVNAAYTTVTTPTFRDSVRRFGRETSPPLSRLNLSRRCITVFPFTSLNLS